MPRRPTTAYDQADALATRLVKDLDDESFLLELAARSPKATPHARAALRLTRLQIAGSFKRYATLFEVSEKKSGAEVAQCEHDPEM
jgi:hypothetical protein